MKGNKFKCCLIGDGALLIASGELIEEAGHEICCVVTSNTSIREWSLNKGIECLESEGNYYDALTKHTFEYLFSIVYLNVIPNKVLSLPKKMSINFHDSLLPRYAGIHATSWALINREKKHGITWHVMVDAVDRGNILKQYEVNIEQGETAISLNLKCYEAGLLAFEELLDELTNGGYFERKQNFSERLYFKKYERPPYGCIISWNWDAEQLDALLRALKFGQYQNKLGVAKLAVNNSLLIVKDIEVTDIKSNELPGTITEFNEKFVRIATGSYYIQIYSFVEFDGSTLTIPDFVSKYNIRKLDRLIDMNNEKGNKITEIYNAVAKNEDYWVKKISYINDLPQLVFVKNFENVNGEKYGTIGVPIPQNYIDLLCERNDKFNGLKGCVTAFSAFLANEYNLDSIYMGLSYGALKEELEDSNSLFSNIVPIWLENIKLHTLTETYSKVSDEVESAVKNKTYPYDIALRYPQIAQGTDLKNIFPICAVQIRSIESYLPTKEICLSLILADNSPGWHLIYSKEIFNETRAVNFVEKFKAFLTRRLLVPENNLLKVSTISEEEIRNMVFERKCTECDYLKDKYVYHLFEERAKEDPEAVAVIFEDNMMSYGELDEKASMLAGFLSSKGVGRGILVGIYMDRDIDILVSMLGILKAGGAYVPLDPIYPFERIEYMINDAEISIILTQEKVVDNLSGISQIKYCIDKDWKKIAKGSKSSSRRKHTSFANKEVKPDDLAYVIFTSGSTGKPKGVEITHKGLVNFLNSMAKEPGFTKNDRIIALTTICFDISALEIFLPLITGGQVEIVSSEVSKDGFKLKEKIESGSATVVQATPATWEMLLAVEWEKTIPIKILCGGEALNKDLAQKLLARSAEVWNVYGPTETTIWSSVSRVLHGEEITIGYPIDNTQLYILDENLNPVPDGVEGELCIGGDGVARGYLKRPDLTNEKFIPNPFDQNSGSRIYRTGDAARYLPDGRVVCLGRIDNQVKLRGFRIELEEIESVLKRHIGFQKAVVALREDEDGHKSLTAFVVPKDRVDIKPVSEINQLIKGFLPDYMLPGSYVFVDNHPHTFNNKVDRKLLSTSPLNDIKDKYGFKSSGQLYNDEGIEARTSQDVSEEKHSKNVSINPVFIHNVTSSVQKSIARDLIKDLVDIVAGVVKVKSEDFETNVPIGEYGYDSIRFTTLSMQLKGKYGVRITPAQFYTYTTIESLAEHMLDTYSEQVSKHYEATDELVKSNIIEDARADKEITKETLKETGKITGKTSKQTYKEVDSEPIDINFDEEDTSVSFKREPIAIIGIGGRMPQSPDLDKFWENIVSEKDLITEVPSYRWDASVYSNELSANNDMVISKWGGFIEDVDKFDAAFFNISPREAEQIDPQQRIFLETAWKAIENAGYKPSDFSGSKTGVYVGAVSSDYWDMMTSAGLDSDTYTISGNVKCIIANRISYLLNLTGASASIDTACSSSLVAIHRAVAAIRNGDCDMAIAGGVNIILNPFLHIALSKNGMLSPDGRCKTFDSRANGYVRGEGAGVVILKRLSKALKDRDHIHAIIKGSSENHGGRTNSLTAPNPNAQADLIIGTYNEAGIDPSTVTYIETHGTGTSLGDPIEINGLKKSFEELYKEWGFVPPEKPHCALGSVKTNIGHLEAGAGIAGMLKVILAMQNGILPGLVHFTKQNPYIDLAGSPFYIVEKTKAWEHQTAENGEIIPRRAGVSSFGFGGSNAHVLLEEYKNINSQEKTSQTGPNVFVLSARNEDRLKAYASEILNYLERTDDKNEGSVENGEANFTDVMYTLQVGREPMEERLAAQISNLSELKILLGQYVQGQSCSGVLFNGNSKENRKSALLFIDGEEGEEYIKSIIEKGKMAKLAQLWVMGIDIDWNLLYSDYQPNRVSLPTYPFAKVRHMLTVSANINGVGGSKGIKAVALHPLIDSNESTLEDQMYRKTLTKKDPYLKDHIVNNEVIFPGVAYLEMARAAGDLAFRKHKVKTMKSNFWSRPLVLSDKPSDVFISLKPVQDLVFYEISSLEQHGDKVIHAQGKLIYDNVAGSRNDDYFNIDEIRNRCPMHLSHEDIYKLFEGLGYQYGTMYKPISSLVHNERESLAKVHIPIAVNKESDGFGLHPSLLEGGLQTVIGILGNAKEDSETPYLPVGASEVEILRPLGSTCYAYLKKVGKQNASGNELRKYDIWLLDDEGQVLVRMKEYSLRSTTNYGHPGDGRINDVHSTMYFRGQWEKSELERGITVNEILRNILIFDLDGIIYNEMKTKYQGTYKVFSVRPGDRYREIDGSTFEINPQHQEDYIKLIEALKSRGNLPDKIVHLWCKGDMARNKDELTDQLNLGIYCAFNLAKALITQKLDNPVRALFVYRGERDEEPPHYAGLNGFFKCLRQESVKLQFKLLKINDSNGSQVGYVEKLPDIIVQELEAGEDVEVSYIDDERYVRFFNDIKVNKGLESNSLDDLALLSKENRVYIITGGVGRLGFIFANYLARNAKVRLVLTGASVLSSKRESKIKELQELGTEVIFIKADVSKQEEVINLVNETRARFGKIDGIIHAAGVLRDSYIMNKTHSEMEDVFAPKVFGTVWLDEATKNDNLDFFIMFSSISSVLGNVGQADYAYANSFMDSYATMRENLRGLGKRNGKSLSINWSFWREGGMKLNDENRQLMERTVGVKPLETEDGLAAFLKCFELNGSNFIVVSGERNKIYSVLNNRFSKTSRNSGAIETKKDKDELVDFIKKDLIRICSGILKIDEEKLETDRNISEFGFDSMSNTEFANLLNKKYNLDITPVLFFEYTTIAAIAKHLYTDYTESFEQLFSYSKVPVKDSEYDSQEKYFDSGPIQGGRFLQIEHENVSEGSAKAFDTEPIAIIGMSGIMPQSEDLDEFWINLRAGKDLITEVPGDRWDWREYYGDPKKELNKTNSKWGGFMQEIDKFDREFFNIPSREADLMDPQQRIFLETVWKAIEDAGYRPSDFSGTNTGLYVGLTNRDYLEYLRKNNIAIDAESTFGNNLSFLVNRVAYFLNLRGPNEPIDTLCSSSLVAIHRAICDIRSGNCDMAIAGGISIIMSPVLSIAFNQAGMLSEDGKCRTFDARANGFVRGEGSGALLLKSLSKAEKDGDRIYAVIKGTAVNHGGRANTLTSPNLKAQAEVVLKAIDNAGIDPATITYVEAHGTGTALGDPIEVNSLKKAFTEAFKIKGKALPEHGFCGIGSVKTNIGHLESAAGIASVLKVVQSMKHGEVPASINFGELNPYIKLEGSPFYIVDKIMEWKEIRDESGNPVPRRAGVSAFGAGGLNAHIVIEDYVNERTVSVGANGPWLIVLSARNRARLKEYAGNLLRYIDNRLKSHDDESILNSVSYTLQTGREAMEERLAVVTSGLTDLVSKLEDYLQDKVNIMGVFEGSFKARNKVKSLKDDERIQYPSANSKVDGNYLQNVAKLWLEGSEVDWKQLYRLKVPEKISLPTYPFARTRCWVESGGDRETPTENIASVPGQVVEFQYNEPYLRDHTVLGNQVLLGVTYGSLAIEAAKTYYGGRKLTNIHRLLFTNPLILTSGEKVKVFTAIEEINGRSVFKNMFVKNKQSVATEGASGVLRFEALQVPQAFDLNEFTGTEYKVVEGDYLYNKRWSGKVVYGQSLHTIRKLYIKEDVVMGELALSYEIMENFKNYSIHPALFDAAIISGLSGFMEDEREPYIPFMINDVNIYGELPALCYCICKQVKRNREVLVIDCYICSKEGKVLVELIGFTCKRVPGNQLVLNEKFDEMRVATAQKEESLYSINIGTSIEKKNRSTVYEIEEYLAEKIAAVIGGDSSDVSINRNFMDLGIDSEGLVTFTGEIEKDLEIELSPALFFEYQNINELSEYFKDNYHKQYNEFTMRINGTGEYVQMVKETEKPTVEHIYDDIAVIGMSGVFAGSPNLNELWKNLRDKKDLITEIPLDHFDYRPWYDPQPQVPDKMYTKWGGFINDVDKFDAAFFNISRREAEVMDPQLRILLQELYAAADDAGYSGQIRGTKTGMYVGACFHDYQQRMDRLGIPVGPHDATGNAATMLANRPSFCLDLKGPSLAVDTACSSSLVALHLACKALQRNECDMSFAAGANLLLESWHYRYFCSIGALSATGRSHAFTNEADGYIPGEGIAAVLLKPLKKAIADHDNIYAVIKGSAINHGGYTPSVTAPSIKLEAQVIMDAWKDARIDPETIGYIEAHGTGTKLGDPIEISGIKMAFERYTKKAGFCAIGSAKAHIGHTEGTAGVAGLIKVILSMKHKEIPAMPYFKEINPYIQIEGSPLYINREVQEWNRINGAPRRAGISSFGAGGAYAHAVVEEYMNNSTVSLSVKHKPCLIVLSAKSKEKLKEYALLMINHLENLKQGMGTEDYSDKNNDLKKNLKEIISSFIGIDQKELNFEDNILEYGLDRVGLVKVLEQMNSRYGIDFLSGLVLVGEYSINSLASAICEIFGHDLFNRNQVKSGLYIKDETLDNVLENISFTLQVGREAMEERLAIIASSIDELKSNLGEFVLGNETNVGMFKGSVKLGRVNKTSVVDSYIQNVVTKVTEDELMRIAKLWVAGGNIDWGALYHDYKPRRVSLPTYPFAKERYWIEEFEKSNYIKIEKNIENLYPLQNLNVKESIVSNETNQPSGISLQPCLYDQIQTSKPVGKTQQSISLSPISPTSPVSISLPQLGINDESKPVIYGQTGISVDSLQEELAINLAETLYMKRSDVDMEKDFISMGMDSIIGVEWIQEINKKYGISVPASKVYDYPSICEFATFLETELNKRGEVANQYQLKSITPQQSITLSATSVSLSQPVVNDVSKPVIHGQKDISVDSLQEELAISLAETLYMKRSDVDMDKDFISMGMDSIIGVEWIQAINKKYSISVPASKVYDYPSICEFAEFLEIELNKQGGISDQSHSDLTSSFSLEEVLQQVYQGTLDAKQAHEIFNNGNKGISESIIRQLSSL